MLPEAVAVAPDGSVTTRSTRYTPGTAKGWVATAPSATPPSPKVQRNVRGPPSGSVDAEASNRARSPARTEAAGAIAATGGASARAAGTTTSANATVAITQRSVRRTDAGSAEQ